jgi:hypothetical protein
VTQREQSARALHAVSRQLYTYRELREPGYDAAIDPRVWDYVMDHTDKDLLRLRNLGVRSLEWLRANQPLRREEVMGRLRMYSTDAGTVGRLLGIKLAQRRGAKR